MSLPFDRDMNFISRISYENSSTDKSSSNTMGDEVYNTFKCLNASKLITLLNLFNFYRTHQYFPDPQQCLDDRE